MLEAREAITSVLDRTTIAQMRLNALTGEATINGEHSALSEVI